jgi:hypothetical protein
MFRLAVFATGLRIADAPSHAQDAQPLDRPRLFDG